MMESRKFVKALKYMHFFDKKFEQANFPLFVNFTPGNLKYMDMKLNMGIFPCFKGDIVHSCFIFVFE